LVRTFAKSLVSEGMIADYSIHDKNDGNPHVHILTTMRGIDDNGKWLEKVPLAEQFQIHGTTAHLCFFQLLVRHSTELHDQHILLEHLKVMLFGKWMSKQKKVYSLDEGGNRIPIIDKKTGQQKISNDSTILF